MLSQFYKSLIILSVPLFLLASSAAAQKREGVIEHLRVDTMENSDSTLIPRIRSDDNRIFELPSAFAESFSPRTRVEFSLSDFRNSDLNAEALEDNITIIKNPGELTDLQHRALIVKLSFNDGDVACGNKKLSKILYKAKKNVRDWFLETSFQNVDFNFDGDLDGNLDIASVNIDQSVSGECDYDSWASEADSALEEEGYVLDDYEHITYLVPESTACDWGGLGTVSCGDACRIWIRGCKNKSLYMHEYGHNLGFDHASLDEDGDEESDSEYGDLSCPMGTALESYRHFNGPHKAQAGWIPDEQIVEYDNDTHIQLSAVELSPESLTEEALTAPVTESGQVAKLPIAESKVGFVVLENYYASFRRKKGKYSKKLSKSYVNAITIHKKHVLSGQTIEVATLTEPDQSFIAENGSRITYLDRNKDNAVIWMSEAGNAAETFTLSGDIKLKNDSPVSEQDLEKMSIVIKKKYVRNGEAITIIPDSSGAFNASLPYGTYILKFRYPKKRYKLAKGKKRQSILVQQSNEPIAYRLKK